MPKLLPVEVLTMNSAKQFVVKVSWHTLHKSHGPISCSIIILALITIIVAVSCFILCTEDKDELMQPTTLNMAKLYSGGGSRANDPTGSTPPNLGWMGKKRLLLRLCDNMHKTEFFSYHGSHSASLIMKWGTICDRPKSQFVS